MSERCDPIETPMSNETSAHVAQPAADSPPPSPAPPRSVRPRTVVAAIAAIVVALWVGTKVGVRFVSAEGATPQDPAADSNPSRRYYTCGMHPWVVLPHPGPCPICGMPLVPLDPAKFSGEMTIDPVVVQNIGVRVAPVVRGPLIRTIRTVGTVDYDETRVRDVNVKVAGWVQKLYVDSLGQPVRKGDPLFQLYSPDLYTAQQEYLLALKGGPVAGTKAMLDAARTKLEYDDVPPAEIADLARRGRPAKTMTLRSPWTGVVVAKKAFEGMRIDPGMQVFRIADLSRIWVMVTLYEYQLPYVHVGQAATMTLPYLPGEELNGKIVYVYPYLDAKARQAQVRVEFENPGLALKPGMYATVSLEGRQDDLRVLAPRESVIDTGERKVAFVSKGNGHFQPRQVRTGVETDGGMVEILEGLEPGEQVVTSGQFLLDSEAKVREALAKMIRGTSAVQPSEPAAARTDLSDEDAATLTSVLGDYLGIGRALADDELAKVPARALAIAGSPGRISPVLRKSAQALSEAKTLAAARVSFRAMSDEVVRLARASGVPAGIGPLNELHCPMYPADGSGASWLQAPGEVRNPYLGRQMLACFDRRTPLPGAGGAGGGRP